MKYCCVQMPTTERSLVQLLSSEFGCSHISPTSKSGYSNHVITFTRISAKLDDLSNGIKTRNVCLCKTWALWGALDRRGLCRLHCMTCSRCTKCSRSGLTWQPLGSVWQPGGLVQCWWGRPSMENRPTAESESPSEESLPHASSYRSHMSKRNRQRVGVRCINKES